MFVCFRLRQRLPEEQLPQHPAVWRGHSEGRSAGEQQRDEHERHHMHVRFSLGFLFVVVVAVFV